MAGALLEQIIAKATRYCSSKERAPYQVKEKLIKWGAKTADTDEIIQKLTEENFINEERFARAYCHDKFEFNKWGKIKIRYNIQKFRLPEAIVEAGLSNINEERYYSVLVDEASKKWLSLKQESDSFVRRQKTANFLIRRGFESAVIYPVIDKLE